MAIVNSSLSDQMREYINDRISEGNYSTTSECFRDLVRENQKRRTQERLETTLMCGLESPLSEWTKDNVNYVKNAVRERWAMKHRDP